jgi:hypothetical protein
MRSFIILTSSYTVKTAVEISAKDRDEPVVQNPPEANGW